METNKWLTLDELVKYLKLSRTKLYQMAQQDEIPAFKIGSQWRFNRKEIDDWMTSQRLSGVSQGSETGNDVEGT